MKALFAPLALTFSLFAPPSEPQPNAVPLEPRINSSALRVSQSLETASGRGLETLQIYNVAISVANLDESIEWYEDKLGFQLENRRNVSTGIEIALIEKNGFYIDLIYIAGSENVEGNPQDPPDHLKVQGLRNLVFWVDDLQTTDAELKSNGVQLIWESRYIPEVGTSVTNFRDNNGNLIAIWER